MKMGDDCLRQISCPIGLVSIEEFTLITYGLTIDDRTLNEVADVATVHGKGNVRLGDAGGNEAGVLIRGGLGRRDDESAGWRCH
jgi:hypothetical protein